MTVVLYDGLTVDGNKLKVLQELPYRIRDVCQSCRHSDFTSGGDFGYCAENIYNHLKHDGDEHFLSVHVTGWCPKYQRSKYKHLGSFEQFIETS